MLDYTRERNAAQALTHWRRLRADIAWPIVDGKDHQAPSASDCTGRRLTLLDCQCAVCRSDWLDGLASSISLRATAFASAKNNVSP